MNEYTPRGLSWKTLKSGDRLRASALTRVADALGLEMHLVLADVQEIWNCEIDESAWGYGSRRRHWDDDEIEEENNDEANAELLELIDDSTIIKYWRDVAGKIVTLPEYHVRNEAICWIKANNELKPFESEHEGWMANYGNTMERWHHRAAIILWRREEQHAVTLEIAPEVMIRELLQLAQKKMTRHDRKVWPLAKGRRQHIHQTIDAMGIPVTHKTGRSGSLHKLHLKKTKQLFLQD